MAGKPGCGGKKGRSGRRPLSVEMRRRAIIDKAWHVVDDGLSDPKIHPKIKLESACKLAAKDMPTEIKGGVMHVVLMPTIQKGEARLEFNIGQIADPADNT